jgi:hypothetical protein
MARRQSITGHISQASLPEFDPDSSSGTWYRDDIAIVESRTMAASSLPP